MRDWECECGIVKPNVGMRGNGYDCWEYGMDEVIGTWDTCWVGVDKEYSTIDHNNTVQ